MLGWWNWPKQSNKSCSERNYLRLNSAGGQNCWVVRPGLNRKETSPISTTDLVWNILVDSLWCGRKHLGVSFASTVNLVAKFFKLSLVSFCKGFLTLADYTGRQAKVRRYLLVFHPISLMFIHFWPYLKEIKCKTFSWCVHWILEALGK